MADTEIGIAFGITTLPHLRSLSIVGPHRVTGVSDTPSRRRVFSLPPAVAGRRNGVRGRHRPPRRHAGVPPAGEREGSCAADDVLRARPQGKEFRVRRHEGARSDSREPAVPLPGRGSAGCKLRRTDAPVSAGRVRAGLAAVVLPVGQRPRRGVAEARGAGPAGLPGAMAEAGEAAVDVAARRCAGHALCLAVAAPAGSRARHSGSDPVSVLGSDAVARAARRKPSCFSRAWFARTAACWSC